MAVGVAGCAVAGGVGVAVGGALVAVAAAVLVGGGVGVGVDGTRVEVGVADAATVGVRDAEPEAIGEVTWRSSQVKVSGALGAFEAM